MGLGPNGSRVLITAESWVTGQNVLDDGGFTRRVGY